MNGIVKKITAASKKAFEAHRYKSLTIVLGNVSCDLDSAICAVVYAAFLAWRHELIASRVCTKKYRNCEPPTDEVFIPVLNVDRDDYEVKTEVAYMLRLIGLKKPDLIFRNDLDDSKLAADGRETTVVLVDHHVLCDSDRVFHPMVRHIIDHRKRIDGDQWDSRVEVDIEMVGSCSTLIASKIRQFEDGLFFSEAKDAASMLYETIILDTSNFCTKIAKGTPTDLDCVEYFEKMNHVLDPQQNRSDAFRELILARTDCSELDSKQLLKKDAKPKGPIYVATIPMLVKDFLQKVDVESALKAFASRYRVIIVIGFQATGETSKEIALYGLNREDADQLADFLCNWPDPSMELTELSTSIPNVKYFRQNNLKISRKQIMPMLDRFLEEHFIP